MARRMSACNVIGAKSCTDFVDVESRPELRIQRGPGRDLAEQLEPDYSEHDSTGAHRAFLGWYSYLRHPEVRVSSLHLSAFDARLIWLQRHLESGSPDS